MLEQADILDWLQLQLQSCLRGSWCINPFRKGEDKLIRTIYEMNETCYLETEVYYEI